MEPQVQVEQMEHQVRQGQMVLAVLMVRAVHQELTELQV